MAAGFRHSLEGRGQTPEGEGRLQAGPGLQRVRKRWGGRQGLLRTGHVCTPVIGDTDSEEKVRGETEGSRGRQAPERRDHRGQGRGETERRQAEGRGLWPERDAQEPSRQASRGAFKSVLCHSGRHPRPRSLNLSDDPFPRPSDEDKAFLVAATRRRPRGLVLLQVRP